MIRSQEMGWLKEWLKRVCLNDLDRETGDDILFSFRKLWAVARTGMKYRDLRTNESLVEFCESLERLKDKKGEKDENNTVPARSPFRQSAALPSYRHPMDTPDRASESGERKDPNADIGKP